MLAFLFFLACTTPSPTNKPVAVASPAASLALAPAVSALDQDGLHALLTAPGPAPRVINFWATWCRPCLAELPMLAREELAISAEVVLVSTDLPSAGVERPAHFLRQHEVAGPRSARLTVDDLQATLSTVPGWTDQLPHTVIVAADGTLHATLSGALDITRLDEALPAALQGR